MKIKYGKLIIFLVTVMTVLFCCLIFVYAKLLPEMVSNPRVINSISDMIKKNTAVNLIIEEPVLKTGFSTVIKFNVKRIYAEKDNGRIFELNNFKSSFSIKKILSKKIIINKLVAENIFVNADEIEKLFPKTSKTKKSNWSAEVYDALLGVRDCEFIYSINPDVKIHLKGHKIGVNNAKKEKRNVYFQLVTDIYRKDNHVTLRLKDNGKVFFKDKHFYVVDCPLSINNSNIFINLDADKKQNYEIKLHSQKFNINDIIDFLNTQIIENTVQKDALSYLSDIGGNVDFVLNIKNDKLNGNFKINEVKFKIKDVDYVPITLTKGNIDLTPTDVKLSGIEGYYDADAKNKIILEGTVKDYLKTMDTNITGRAYARNDFFKNHLSKIIGTDVEIIGEAPTALIIKSKQNVMDFIWYFMLKPGQNIKVANDMLPFEDSLRMMRADMHFENMILDIKSLDYHMVPKEELPDMTVPREKRPRGERHKPIFRLKSSVDIAHNNDVKFISFEIPEPLQSELLNAVMHKEVFKKGTVSGDLTLDNRGRVPVLNGAMRMDRVLVPSQRTFIKSAVMEAKGNRIYINADGGYRRAKFSFDGDILNEIKFPIMVKDVKFSLENIDLVKALEGINNQFAGDDVVETDMGIVKVEKPQEEFDIRNIIVEKAALHLDKGTYKEIEFGNLNADFTLDKDGVAKIKSNRFDFAEGQSSLRAVFDLVNKKYNVKLGVKEVNSDKIANALLGLKREITGKSSGFMDISTDDSMKLSGSIKFIILDGQVEKIGLVEYVLKCASLLRNTVTMINPATFADIINVPEGNFDKITGTLNLKQNVVTRINIKTFSKQLSTYIAGRYNIENGDSSLRVYVKFSNINKGIAGFMRKLSLNALANRVPMNSRNDENYYSVELSELPEIDADEKDCQIFLTRIEGDVANNNYISSLKKIK